MESVIFYRKTIGIGLFVTFFKKQATSCHDWFCDYFATLHHSTDVTIKWTIFCLHCIWLRHVQFQMVVRVLELHLRTFLCSVVHDSLANNQIREKEVMSLYLVQHSKVLRSSSQSLRWRYRLLHSSRQQENLLPQILSTKYEKDQKVSHWIQYYQPYKVSLNLGLKTCLHKA